MGRFDIDADRIRRGRGDDDLQHARQQRREQEEDVVQRRVEQRADLHGNGLQRALRRFRRLALRRPQREPNSARRGGNRGIDAPEHQIARRQGLGIVEEHHFRPAPGKDVPLQVLRQHQQPVDAPRQQQPSPRGEIGNALGHRRIRRGIDHADDRPRQVGPVQVQHTDRKPGRKAGAEDHGQQPDQGERRDRAHEQQERPPLQPAGLAPEDQPEPGTDAAAPAHVSRPFAPSRR